MARVQRWSKPAIDEVWKPYLDGPALGDTKARDAAIVAILKKMPPTGARTPILEFLGKAYGQSWPADGYGVHLSMYANWSGAYSTDGQLLVVATNRAPARPTSTGSRWCSTKGCISGTMG